MRNINSQQYRQLENGQLSGISRASTTSHPLCHPDLLVSCVKYTPSEHSFSGILLVYVSREIYKKRLVGQAIALLAATGPKAARDIDNSFLSCDAA